MTSRFTKSLFVAAAMISPFLASQGAAANTAGLQVDQRAVELVSESWVDTAQAYNVLQAGDRNAAKQKLDAAVRKLFQASTKDPTLGVAVSTPNAPSTVKAVHDHIKAAKQDLERGDVNQARAELQTLLSAAGVI